MKAWLEFNLPEDDESHQLALKASDYSICLRDIDFKLRNILKHGHNYKSVEDLAEELRGDINQVELY